MSANQGIFKRVEKKYLLDEKQYLAIREKLQGRFEVDKYGKTTISNIYYDTPDHRIIRASLEKPVYKEKLRVRSYGTPNAESTVFVELKKKYKGIVYKRRVDMPLYEAKGFLKLKSQPFNSPQIENEIRWFLSYYDKVAPAMFLCYDRIAMFGVENNDLRITFDNNILYREDALELDKGCWGAKLLETGQFLMEIKIPGTMPLWLAEILDELKIYPTSFSKYGKAYSTILEEKISKGKVISCA